MSKVYDLAVFDVEAPSVEGGGVELRITAAPYRRGDGRERALDHEAQVHVFYIPLDLVQKLRHALGRETEESVKLHRAVDHSR